MIERIWDFFEKSFGINAVVVMMIAIAIFYLVTNLPKIMDSITYFQSRKIKHITEALSSEWVSDDHKEILKKDISALYILVTSKIKVGEKETKEIVKLSTMTGGRFSTIELHHAVNKIGYDFHGLSLEDLKSIKANLEGDQRFDRFMIFLLCLIPILPLWFFQSVEISWNKYSLIIFGIYLGFLLDTIRHKFMSIKQKENAIRVLKYFIRSLNAN